MAAAAAPAPSTLLVKKLICLLLNGSGIIPAVKRRIMRFDLMLC
jgi:hypothetical protein